MHVCIVWVFFQLNLWGNKLDLALSLGQVNTNHCKFLFDTTSLDTDLLEDDSENVWTAVSDTNINSTTVGKFTSYYYYSDLDPVSASVKCQDVC